MSNFQWESEEKRSQHVAKHIFGDKQVPGTDEDRRSNVEIEYELNKWENLLREQYSYNFLESDISEYYKKKKDIYDVFPKQIGYDFPKVSEFYESAQEYLIDEVNTWYEYHNENYYSYNAVCLKDGSLYDTLQVCVKRKDSSFYKVTCFYKNNIRKVLKTKYSVLRLVRGKSQKVTHKILKKHYSENHSQTWNLLTLDKDNTSEEFVLNREINEECFFATNDELLQRSFAYASSFYSFDSMFNEEQNLDIPKSDFIKHYFDYFYWQLSNEEEDVDQKEFYANLSQFLREGKLKNKDQTQAFKQQVKEKYESILAEVSEMLNIAVRDEAFDEDEEFDFDEIEDERFVKLADLALLGVVIEDERYVTFIRLLKDDMLKTAIRNFSNALLPNNKIKNL